MNRRRIYVNLAFLFVISIVLLSAPSISKRRSFVKNPASLLNRSIDLQNALAATSSYDIAFSTYLGGSGYEHARDVFVDAQGYIYVAGGTASPDFPTTFGPAFNSSPCATLGSAGRMDIFVAKFDPNGGRVWSRLLGGPCYDRAYGIEVDNQGHIYIGGRAGEGFPTTAGVFQPDFQGTDQGPYGWQNTFVAKLAQDGSLMWASYVGVGSMARDLALDSNGDVYVPLSYSGVGGVPPSSWFTNAFQKTLQGGLDCGAVKIKSDGTQVLWATWLGGSDDDIQEASIRVDANKNVYLGMRTRSTDIPTTAGAFDRTYNGGWDYYVARLSSDGSSLIFGTYLGGANDEGVNTHTLALDGLGNVYASPWTNSSNFPTTQGAFQTTFTGGIADMTVAKFSPTGALLMSTYIGGSGTESIDGIYVDALGNVFATGATDSLNFPTTSAAYQSSLAGGRDAVMIMLSSDFSNLIYSTYLGGISDDDGRTGFLGQDGNLYVAGQSDGAGWPTLNAFQNSFAGGPLDAVLAKFTASQTTITSTPLPTNTPLPTATTPTPGQTSTPTAPPACTIFIPIVRKPE